MSPTKKQARVAGLLYLLVVFTAPLGEIYVPIALTVRGDATATASRVLASESLFRIGMASQLISAILFLLTVLALYRLLKEVSEKHAALMLGLVLVGVPIAILNVLNRVAALMLFSGPDFLSVFDKPQLDALGYAFLRLNGQGSNIASIFWGLWLFPFGILIKRSGFIPRLLGVFVMIAGFGYLASSFTTILLPRYASVVDQFALPLYFGELPIIFWLLIWGAKERVSGAPSLTSAGV